MCVGSPTAGAWSSFQRRPDDEFETRQEPDVPAGFSSGRRGWSTERRADQLPTHCAWRTSLVRVAVRIKNCRARAETLRVPEQLPQEGRHLGMGHGGVVGDALDP